MSNNKPIDYRKLSSELDAILGELQNGELDIDKALKQYDRGQAVIKQLNEYLKTAENKITQVTTKHK
jgi:exodeoxyribonuclease VII small subunit